MTDTAGAWSLVQALETLAAEIRSDTENNIPLLLTSAQRLVDPLRTYVTGDYGCPAWAHEELEQALADLAFLELTDVTKDGVLNSDTVYVAASRVLRTCVALRTGGTPATTGMEVAILQTMRPLNFGTPVPIRPEQLDGTEPGPTLPSFPALSALQAATEFLGRATEADGQPVELGLQQPDTHPFDALIGAETRQALERRAREES